MSDFANAHLPLDRQRKKVAKKENGIFNFNFLVLLSGDDVYVEILAPLSAKNIY